MKKITYLVFIFVGCLSSCNFSEKKASTDASASNTSNKESKSISVREMEYLKVRNDFVKYFKNASKNSLDVNNISLKIFKL